MKDATTIRILKETHKDLLKVMGQIQARTGEIPTIDDALKQLLENYNKKLLLHFFFYMLQVRL